MTQGALKFHASQFGSIHTPNLSNEYIPAPPLASFHKIKVNYHQINFYIDSYFEHLALSKMFIILWSAYLKHQSFGDVSSSQS